MCGLLIALALSFSPIAMAQKWVPFAVAGRNGPPSTSYTPYVEFMDDRADSLGIYGSATYLQFNDPQGLKYVQTVNGPAVKRVNGVWQTTGSLTFTSQFSDIMSKLMINGVEYITLRQDDSTGLMACNIRMLNPITKHYDPVGIRFESDVQGMAPLTANTLLVWGDFYNAQGSNGTTLCGGLAVWDKSLHAITPIPLVSSYALHNRSSEIYSAVDVSATDGTIFLCGGNSTVQEFHILFPGSATLQESAYSLLPLQEGALEVVVFNKNDIYVLTEDLQYDFHLRHCTGPGTTWQEIAVFTTGGQGSNGYVDMTHLGNTLYFSGNFTTINGVATTSHVTSYQIGGSQYFTDLTDPPAPLSPHCMYTANNQLFFSDISWLLGGAQFLYVWKIVPLTTPTITSTVVVKNTATVSGTADANVFLDLYLAGNGTKLGSTSVGATGTWNASLSGLADGTYQIYAVARNQQGTLSAHSTTSSFTIFTAVPSVPIITGPIGLQKTSSVTIVGTTTPGVLVNLYNSATNAKIVSTSTTTSTNWSVTSSFADAKRYSVYAKAENTNGESAASAPLLFSVDATAPEMPTVLSPTIGAQLASKAVLFKVGPGEAKAQCGVSVDNASEILFTDTITLSYAEGPHTAAFRQIDSAGHASATAIVPFTITLPKPPPSGMVTNNALVIAYPNPTADIVNVVKGYRIMSVSTINDEKPFMTFRLEDAAVTSISMRNYPAGYYVLHYADVNDPGKTDYKTNIVVNH